MNKDESCNPQSDFLLADEVSGFLSQMDEFHISKITQVLASIPFHPLEHDGTEYFIKFSFSFDHYAIMITDLLHVWICFADSKQIETEKEHYNPQLVMARDHVLELMKSKFQERFEQQDAQNEGEIGLSIEKSFPDTSIHFKLQFPFSVFDFVWIFSLAQHPNGARIIRDQFFRPVLFMANALSGRVGILKGLIQKKDDVIQNPKKISKWSSRFDPEQFDRKTHPVSLHAFESSENLWTSTDRKMYGWYATERNPSAEAKIELPTLAPPKVVTAPPSKRSSFKPKKMNAKEILQFKRLRAEKKREARRKYKEFAML